MFIGKTYFFKDKGYWQFDDPQMRVKHELRKRSSTRWMGCKNGRLEHESWRNSKLKEEFDDIDVENYDENDFDFENTSPSSKASYLELISYKFTILVASFTLWIRIFL